MNFQMFELDLEKGEKPDKQLPTSTGLSKKQESSRKAPIPGVLAHQSLRLCGSQ